jgi:hypothetical protein
LADWEFQTPPVIQATVSGTSPEFAKVSGTGQVWLGKTKFRSALLNSASANFHLQNNALRCDQIRVIRDEGIGTGSFTYDFGQDQVTIEGVEANLYPDVVAVWIDTSLGRLLQPFHFTDPPVIHADGTIQLKNGATNDLRIRIDSPNRFRYHFGGWEIPFDQGSGDFSVLGTDTTNFSVKGTVNVIAAKMSGSRLFAPLLTRLEPLGFHEPLDLKLSFRLDPLSLRLVSFQLISGSHALQLTGSLFFPGELVDFVGMVDNGAFRVRGFGTIQDPIWQLISPARR